MRDQQLRLRQPLQDLRKRLLRNAVLVAMSLALAVAIADAVPCKARWRIAMSP